MKLFSFKSFLLLWQKVMLFWFIWQFFIVRVFDECSLSNFGLNVLRKCWNDNFFNTLNTTQKISKILFWYIDAFQKCLMQDM